MVKTEVSPILEAIRSRRSTPGVRPEPPPRELVEQVIDAAGWAPNHYHTEPWRFVVVAGDARAQLGAVMAEDLRNRLGAEAGPEVEQLLDKERRKPLRAPTIIAVGVLPSDRPKVVEVEEIAAAAAGVQNMLLAAQALGLGAMWRTGPAAYSPAVKRFLGLPETAHILSFIYLGYPGELQPPDREHDTGRHTSWVGWD